MKWISVKDGLPNKGDRVLAYINKGVYLGYFMCLEESEWSGGQEVSRWKRSWFDIDNQLPRVECDHYKEAENMRGKLCADCCEEEDMLSATKAECDFSLVTHWMPLPVAPIAKQESDR